MIQTTVGRLLIDDALPQDLRNKAQVLDKKGTQKLFQEIAERYPEQYREIAHKLVKLGADAGYTSGGYSFGLRHLLPAKSALAHRQQIQGNIDRILDDPKLSDDDKQKEIIRSVGSAMEPMEKAIYEESLAEKNPLALQVLSGTKGNKTSLKSLRGGDLLYVDHRDQEAPIPVLRSYPEGLTAAQFFAGSFGARKGLADVKLGTADAGAFAKSLSQLAHRLVVTAHDHDKPHDPGSPVGFPTTVDDPDNEGAFLATETGGYPRNTALTPRVLHDLKQKGVEHLLVRSPITSGPPDGGVYGRDVGIRERGRVAPIGDFVGLGASQSVGEVASQGALCLAEGTLVRMADWSIRKIEDVEAGDMVLGADAFGTTFPVRVLRRHDNGVRECVRTVFSQGSAHSDSYIDLISTLDHQLLSSYHKSGCSGARFNHIPAKYPIGYRAKYFYGVAPCAFDDSAAELNHEPFALFLGLVLGDGCYTRSLSGVFLSCADPVLIEDVQPRLAPLNLKLVKRQAGGGLMHAFSQIKQVPAARDSKTGRVLAGARNPAKRYLVDHGLYGKYAHDKVIPDAAFGWNNASVADLLSGLFATDGCVYYQRDAGGLFRPFVTFGSTSKKMVEQVRDLLMWRFGIYSGPIKSNWYGGRKRPLYSILIAYGDSVIKFMKSIPLVGVKRERIKTFVADWQRSLSAERSKRLKGRAFRYHRKNQEPVGLRQTYDLEVDHPDHLFVLANGLIVSNSSKHSGGVAGAARLVGGFDLLKQLVQVPKTFPTGAAHSQLDGKVSAIEEAPQGGHFITVGDQRHYAAHGHKPLVKIGDDVEAGDLLSEGLPNPAEIVQHYGIGEGRRRWVEQFRQATRSAGFSPHRRNLELLSRGLINHVRLKDEIGDWSPDDVVPYSTFEHHYEPREGHMQLAPKQAVGKYLERPVLHHTIGTRIRPSMLSEFERHGVKSVLAHPDPAPFESVMIRAQENLSKDPDWQTRMLGSNLEKNLLQGAHRADMSDPLGTSFVPSLAKGLGFGTQGKVKGWDSSPTA